MSQSLLSAVLTLPVCCLSFLISPAAAAGADLKPTALLEQLLTEYRGYDFFGVSLTVLSDPTESDRKRCRVEFQRERSPQLVRKTSDLFEELGDSLPDRFFGHLTLPQIQEAARKPDRTDSFLSLAFPFSLFFDRQPVDLASLLETAEYLGQKDVAGQTIHRLRIRLRQASYFQIIQMTAEPRPRLIRVTAKPLQASAAELWPNLAGKTITIHFSDWAFGTTALTATGPKSSADTIVPPTRTPPTIPSIPLTRIKPLTPAGDDRYVDSRQARIDPLRSSATLIGKPAPKFDLKLLNGDRFDPAELDNGKITVLDFWASWCGPCVAGMPELAKIDQDYRERGISVVAVNLRETPETIRKFLDRKKLELTVVLDPKATAGQLYRVRGIPQTVVIGRDGTIEKIFVGFNPNSAKQLRNELDRLCTAPSAPDAPAPY